MALSKIPPRGRIVIVGFVLLITPALLLSVTLVLLMIGRTAVLSGLSIARLVELYVVKVVLFAVFAAFLYWFLRTSIERRLPEALDELERERSADDPADERETRSTRTDDRNGR